MSKSKKSEEVEVKVDPAKPGADKSVEVTVKGVEVELAEVEQVFKEIDKTLNKDGTLKDTSEAKGNANAEEVSEISSESESEVAPADSDSDSEVTSDSVSEAVVSLPIVSLEFADEEVISFDVDADLQLVLRKVCNDQGERPTSFEVEGDISDQELRLLSKVIK